MEKLRPKYIRPLAIVTYKGEQGRFHGHQIRRRRDGTISTILIRVKVLSNGRWAYWPAPLRKPKWRKLYVKKPIDPITIEARRLGILRKSYVQKLKRQRATGIPNHG